LLLSIIVPLLCSSGFWVSMSEHTLPPQWKCFPGQVNHHLARITNMSRKHS
jgi:hypothetical protein